MYKQNEISFKKAVLSLYQLDFIKEIKKILDEKSVENVSICFPKLESQQNKIHFIISREKRLSFFEIAELTASIEDILKYDGVIIEFKELFKEGGLEKLFDHFVPFSAENFKAVQTFLKEHYSQFFKQPVSTPFWSEESESLAKEVIFELKENNALWKKLASATAKWGVIQQQVKEELDKEELTFTSRMVKNTT